MPFAEPVVAEALFAERIDGDNAQQRRLGGPDAIGGVGDWALGNGVLCAVVADASHESDVSTRGGGLVDLGFCGREDDQFLLYQELLNRSIADPVPYQSLFAEVRDGVARVVAIGGREGVAVRTAYELDGAEPRRLLVRTTVSRAADAMELEGYAAAIANVRGLTPFSLSFRDDVPSRGFTHPAHRGRGLSGVMEAAIAADGVVGVGADELRPGIAYGLRVARAERVEEDGSRVVLPQFLLADSLASVVAVFPDAFWIGDGRSLGWLQVLQAPLLGLASTARLELDVELWVGERSDVASVTDLLLPEAPWLRGRVDDARAVVHVARADGRPFTHVRVGERGRFALRAPPGRYRLRAVGPGGRAVEREVGVEDADVDVGDLLLGEPARVLLPRGEAMRLIFVGEDGTPDPDFGDDFRDYTLIEDDGPMRPRQPERDVHLAGSLLDPLAVTVAPGRYRVLATRGPEFSLSEARFELRAGESVDLALEPPRRVLETPGWISADFHVHSAPSLDNGTSVERRIASYLAQGAEVLISSEHDHVYDFAPKIRSLGVEGLPSIVGLEITSEVKTAALPQTIGHANVFPPPADRTAYRGGGVANEGRRWREIFAELRALPGERVIQLNHPRGSQPGVHPRAFLTHMGPANLPFQPGLPIDRPPNDVLLERDPKTGLRDIDFDAMEVMNGPHFERYQTIRADWFALLRQGVELVGTANSDSHFTAEPVASPRNYVRVEERKHWFRRGFDEAAFVRSILDGRVYGTTGPLLEIELAHPAGDASRVGASGIGVRFTGREGVLRGRVLAASWVPVDRLLVYVNGELRERRAISPGIPFEIPLAFDADAFVVVEAMGEADERFALVVPKLPPIAFSNPIWVDANADQRWDPPGLPVQD